MAVASFILACFVLSHLQLNFVSAESQMSCPMFLYCEKLGFLAFPFSNSTYPQCGLCTVNCDHHHQFPQIQLGNEGPWFDVKGSENHNFNLSNISRSIQGELEIHDQMLQSHLDNKSCLAFSNLTFPNSPSISFTIPDNLTFFKCNKGCEPDSDRAHELFKHFPRETCEGFELIYKHQAHPQFLPPDLQQCCSVVQLPMNQSKYLNPNTSNPFELLTATFYLQLDVSKDCIECQHSGGQCQNHNQTFRCLQMPKEERTLNSHSNNKAKFRLILAAGVASFATVITIILLCFFSKKVQTFGKLRTEDDQNIETFLKNFESLVPLRYSYSEVKKIANSFKDKLGEGGYGSVFKGKLKNGQLVAVKLLKEAKGNGEEFVNEVASISRTSHVNVVTLLGFCYEGHKRALIYEFMPNGSLEKFIYKRSLPTTERQLGWESLYKIAVGIARGLEYLHLGCNTRILHFDIKPHNILLDQDLCPKISDFGLSKLCLDKESTISRLSTRGTVGYIAPEVLCRNFGVVSSKSDVYSYGMMILEVVGEKKDIDAEVDHTSEIYFPEWIYKHLELDEEIGLHGITNEVGNEKRKKMIIVGLWCIQTDPSNRPSMSRVMEMLEGSLESLQIPPKPFLFSPPRAPKDSSTIDNVTSGSTYSVPSLKQELSSHMHTM